LQIRALRKICHTDTINLQIRGFGKKVRNLFLPKEVIFAFLPVSVANFTQTLGQTTSYDLLDVFAYLSTTPF
jgi:hypothetical protein